MPHPDNSVMFLLNQLQDKIPEQTEQVQELIQQIGESVGCMLNDSFNRHNLSSMKWMDREFSKDKITWQRLANQAASASDDAEKARLQHAANEAKKAGSPTTSTYCRLYFGYTKFAEMLCDISIFFPDIQFKRSIAGAPLTPFEKCLAARLYMKTGWLQKHLFTMLGGPSNESRWLKEWTKRWGLVSRIMLNRVITKELLLSHQPEGMKDRYEKPIGVLTDGTVVTIDTPRKSSLQQRATYNNKMHTNGVLGIVWTSACGMLLRNTSMYCGRVGEEQLVWLHCQLLADFPADFARLVDKGFTHCTGAYKNFLQAYFPAFVQNGEIDAAKVKDAKKQSADRYVVETFYARVKRWLILCDRCRYSNIHILDDAWHVACASSDNDKFLREPHDLHQTFNTLCKTVLQKDSECQKCIRHRDANNYCFAQQNLLLLK